MDKTKKTPPRNALSDHYQREFIEVGCSVCDQRKIICVPEETIPCCDYCRVEMVLKEVQTEGKY